MNNERKLSEIAKVFFKLGCIGFGGPAVHIAMIEEEVVKKRGWLTKDHFLDLVGATNLIPGPNSTEITMHCGQERAGWKGLVVAGLCFIFPAVIITGIFAWTYQRYGKLPEAQPFIYGIKPAIIAVIASLVISLGKKALKSAVLGIIGAAAALLALLGVNEILLLFGGGAIGVIYYLLQQRSGILKSFVPLLFLEISTLAVRVPDLKLFWIFLRTGAILYGSGYVLFAFLDAQLVATGMLSRQELLDAIAVGQFTPGPVFSSATFIGWQIGGLPGAIAATVGIFLPSFLFVALLNPVIPKLRRSPVMTAFLDTVNMISVALIIAICVEMGREAITDWRTIIIAISGFLITNMFPKLNSAFVILAGSAVGFLLSLF